jgi:hypothetical protein
MSPETLWNRYAAIWSRDVDSRASELEICLADDVSYCDPNGQISGRAALSDYMGALQKNMPGVTFRITSVDHHHNDSLAHWSLCVSNSTPLQSGISFGQIADDGRLRKITGFFIQTASSA